MIVLPTFDHADWQFRDDVIPRTIVAGRQDRVARYILSENAPALRGQVFLMKKLLEDGTLFLLGA